MTPLWCAQRMQHMHIRCTTHAYNVGTLSHTIPYHTIPYRVDLQEADEAAYKQGVEQGTIKPGLGPFGMYQKPKNSGGGARATSKRSRPSKADEAGLKLCQFCDRRKPLARFPMRLIMTCKGHAERRLGAHV